MTITLPDTPATATMSEADLRLELACALFAQGKVGKVGGADLAGLDFFEFQRALAERRICTLTIEDVRKDVAALDRVFAKHEAPRVAE